MKLSKGAGLALLGIVLVVIDQVIKVLVKTNMSLGEQIPLMGSGAGCALSRTKAWLSASLSATASASCCCRCSA